jgi:hypothetical protein
LNFESKTLFQNLKAVSAAFLAFGPIAPWRPIHFSFVFAIAVRPKRTFGPARPRNRSSPSLGCFELPPPRAPPSVALLIAKVAKLNWCPTDFTSPRETRSLHRPLPPIIAETIGVKLHRRPPASQPLRSPDQPIKGTLSPPLTTSSRAALSSTPPLSKAPSTELHCHHLPLFVDDPSPSLCRSVKFSVSFVLPPSPSLSIRGGLWSPAASHGKRSGKPLGCQRHESTVDRHCATVHGLCAWFTEFPFQK